MVSNLESLSFLTGISESESSDLARNILNQYKPILIRKKDNSQRQLWIPNDVLKPVQRKIHEYLKSQYKPPSCVHGLDAMHTIIANAHYHARGPYLLSLDIRDFFPSVHTSRVRRVLSSYFSNEALDRVVALSTLHHELPQGAPTSPLIANIALANLDRRLLGLAVSLGLRYTRYFDDLFFSGSRNLSRFSTTIANIVDTEGYKIKVAKTHHYGPGQVRLITGIEISPDSTLHIPNENLILQRLRNLSSKGIVALEDECIHKHRTSLYGLISYVKTVNPQCGLLMQNEFHSINWSD